MKRSVFIGMLALILSAQVALAGDNKDYYAQNTVSDNIGFVLGWTQYKYNDMTAEEVQTLITGRHDDVLFLAICGNWSKSATATNKTLVCTLSVANMGDTSFTLNHDDVALVDDLGIRSSAVSPEGVENGYRLLDSERVPPGQGVDTLTGFEYVVPATYPLRIEIFPEDWEEPVVLLILNELSDYPMN